MRSVASSRMFAGLPRLPFAYWAQVAAERRRLARLDAEQLADMGISPSEAAREAARPFWDVSGRR